MRETLRELLPSVAEALGGAGDGSGPDIERLGVSTDEVRDFALTGLNRRLDIIGVPLCRFDLAVASKLTLPAVVPLWYPLQCPMRPAMPRAGTHGTRGTPADE